MKERKKRGSKDGCARKEEATHKTKRGDVCVCVCVVCHPDIQRRLEGNQAYGSYGTRGIIMSSYTLFYKIKLDTQTDTKKNCTVTYRNTIEQTNIKVPRSSKNSHNLDVLYTVSR